MFLRKTKVRLDGNIYEYVRIVENYRKNGKTHWRAIANLGNIKNLKKDVGNIIKGFCRISKRDDLNIENLKAKGLSHYRDILTCNKK